jgi:hypothetical protein
MADALGVAQSVLQRDEPPERVAEDGDLLEAQALAQGVGIGAQLAEGDGLRRRPARASRSVVSVSYKDLAIRRKPKGWKSETTSDISSLSSGEVPSVKNSCTHRGTNLSGGSEDSRKHL